MTRSEEIEKVELTPEESVGQTLGFHRGNS